MARPDIIVGPGAGYPFETGVRIWAAMAFPLPAEEPRRADAEIAWSAQILKGEFEKNPTPFADNRLNDLLRRDPKWVNSTLRTAMRRYRDRCDVARVVRPWVRELIGLDPHRPVSGIPKFTQRQIALWLNGGDEGKASRFQERQWRISRPVIHMAIAMNLEATRRQWPEAQGIPFDDLDFYRTVVTEANDLQRKIAEDRRFMVKPEEQLTFIWKN